MQSSAVRQETNNALLPPLGVRGLEKGSRHAGLIFARVAAFDVNCVLLM
jgi:hypothetical protein